MRVLFCLMICFSAFAFQQYGTGLFNNETVTVTTPIESKVVDVYGYSSIDWKGEGTAVKGEFKAYASNGNSRWYEITKDYAGANVSMAITSTGTTTSGFVNLGVLPVRFLKLIYTPDPTVATGAVINSSFMTKGF
jgi:hypothetical protein